MEHREQTSAPAVYRIAKAILRRPLHRLYDITVEGHDVLPDGPLILAANHRSFLDSVFLALVVDRPVSFLAKAEYFDDSRIAWFLRATGQIPVRRGSPAGARKAIDEADLVLAGGGVVGVYPEGTRSRDGRLHRGKLGPARLAAASGAPLVPIGLIGTDAVQPPGARLPHIRKAVAIRFGSPRWLDAAAASDRRRLRDATDGLMDEVAELCGQHGPRAALALA
jgi:1-acyl-sn-glycerol-3-phosphate acyltransferase